MKKGTYNNVVKNKGGDYGNHKAEQWSVEENADAFSFHTGPLPHSVRGPMTAGEKPHSRISPRGAAVRPLNGVEIPAVGLGTFTMSPDQAEDAVYNALQSGYRLIDTANAYMNEKAVGRGIRKSDVKREDVFLSTKLWPSAYKDESAVEKTLARLGTGYADLLFLHQPSGDWKAGYRQLEKAYKEGKTRAIGISNFTVRNIRELFSFAEIRPQVIQLEDHPYFTAEKEREALKDAGTRVMAWYPLGHGDRSLVNEPLFAELGKKYGKSPAQVILRWHIQYGNIVIPGSTNPQHIKDNIDLFDFRLTEEEMNRIAGLNKNRRYYHQNAVVTAGYALMKMDFDSQK